MYFLIPDEHKHKSGIYRIYDIHENKSYIGCTSNFWKRYIQHKVCLISSTKKLNQKFKEFTEQHSVFDLNMELIELCPKKYFEEKENFYIEKYNSIENGFNCLRSVYNSRKTKEPKKLVTRLQTNKERRNHWTYDKSNHEFNLKMSKDTVAAINNLLHKNPESIIKTSTVPNTPLFSFLAFLYENMEDKSLFQEFSRYLDYGVDITWE